MQTIQSAGSLTARAKFSPTAPLGQNDSELLWHVAEETAVGILVNGEPVTVMMATPVDLEDLAVGFLLAEGYLESVLSIRRIRILSTETGFCVNVAGKPLRRKLPGRSMEGRSGCGLCGINALTDVTFKLPHRVRPALLAEAVSAAFGALTSHQPMNAANHSVHAAGFATRDGAIHWAREDVGRHNALDKLIGALKRNRIDGHSGFAVMTSRCSFELVQKAAIAGLGGLATLSAPTALALQMARRAGLPLASRAPGGVALF
ncbi:MAG TPA: formate dehydrogenase accessory sulfurtransferase FdhD [Burkholderiales bacterium]|nr:formate dehydrogenase accessory sulfurtransferase FdhD [Burkholderiales bacterium]